MDKTSKSWFIIINPTSGNGSAKKKWPKIERLLIKHHFYFEFAFTKYANHSSELAQQAISKSITQIICIGGDGTLHNIVNGIMNQKMIPSNKVHVGVIPIGTGNDWVKTHQIPKNIELAIRLIKNNRVAQQDIGKIEFLDEAKAPVYFNNLAGVGFDGYVVSKVNKYKHIGALAYLFGALMSLFSFKNFSSKVAFNSEKISGKTLMVLVGLCKYSGGGMQLTKTPDSFDGLLDISIAKDFKKFDIIKNITKLFNGKIVDYKKVHTAKTDSIIIEIDEKQQPFIQADGELIGTGHIKVSLIPKAFSFYGN